MINLIVVFVIYKWSTRMMHKQQEHFHICIKFHTTLKNNVCNMLGLNAIHKRFINFIKLIRC